MIYSVVTCNTPINIYFTTVINCIGVVIGVVIFLTVVNVSEVEGVREAVRIEDIEMGEVDINVEMGDGNVDEDMDMGADENHLFG